MYSENEIFFIVCYNNDAYANECMLYINRLNVQEGYNLEMIFIKGQNQ